MPTSRRTVLLAFLGFFLLAGSWSVLAPYDGAPDEIDHIVRAVGVVSGEVAPEPAAAKRGSGAFQQVPAGLVRENCWAFEPTRSAACARPPGGDEGTVTAPTGAGRYFPVYYAVVGWPLLWWPDWTGVIVARLLGAAICAGFLAAAFAAVSRHSGGRLMTAALLVAVTPMTAYLAGSVNPNGPEIAAAAAFFAATIVLFLGDAPPGQVRGLVTLMGVSGVALAVLRTTGLLWLLLAAVLIVLPWRSATGALLRTPRVWLWAAAVAVSGVAAAIWIIVMRANDLGDYTTDRVLTLSQALLVEAENWRYLLEQVVGVTGWLDTRMSGVFYLLYLGLIAALVLLGLAFGGAADRWRVAVLSLGMVVPAVAEVLAANETGFISQGRYYLPVVAGILLLSGSVLDRRGFPAQAARSFARLLVVPALLVHLVCFLYSGTRWRAGLPEVGDLRVGDMLSLAGDWQPVAGPVVPLVAQVAGIVLLGVLAWRASAVPHPAVASSAPVPDGSDTAARTVAVTR